MTHFELLLQPSRCADVDGARLDYKRNPRRFRTIYEAQVGDIIWTYGKTGGDNLGHVIDRIASCESDTRYCQDSGWSKHEHGPERMCECGELHMADHHWELVPQVGEDEHFPLHFVEPCGCGLWICPDCRPKEKT